jgi:flagellar basal-body rod protein FlgG
VRVAFRDLLYTQTGAGAAPGVASGAGAAVTQIGRGSAQGAMQRTENPLDVAISGSGFFQVRDREGRVALTRAGALVRDENGRLMTAHGADTGLRLPKGISDDDVKVGQTGVVTAGGREIGRLRVVDVRAPEHLQAMGDNLFRPTAESGAPRAADQETRISQGLLEGSNVQMAEVMAEMMETQNAFQMGSRALSTQDRLLEIANGIKR